jgi:hypothetical protein
MIGGFLKSSFSGYLAIAGVFIIVGLVWYIRNEGYQSCLTDQLTKTVGIQHETAKLEIEIMRLDDAALVRRYCRWVYDVPYNECVETVTPIQQVPADKNGYAEGDSPQRSIGE